MELYLGKKFAMRWIYIGSFVAIFFLGNCRKSGGHFEEGPLFKLLPSDKTGVDFINQLLENEQLNILTFEYFYNGGGVAVGDVNNDGWQDIFFTANMTESRLFLNEGGLKFKDATAESRINTQHNWATGASMVDINADGWLDLYVCFAGPYEAGRRANQFYINQGNGVFAEKAQELGLADTGHTTHAAFFDYDLDGDLDVYLLTNIMEAIGPNVIRPKKLNGQSPNTDRLYRNDNGHFTNVSKEAGILIEGYGLGVSIADINQDGWPDIYVSNDYLSNDLLYLNNQNGTFTDRAAEYFRHTSYSAMGNDVADYNNDGLVDIVTVDMLPPDNLRRKLMFPSINYDRFRSEMLSGYFPQYVRNTLQLNQGFTPEGKIAFSEIGQLAGVHSTDWSWSALLADADNDGWKDLLITNGYPRDITNLDFVDYKMNNLLKSQYNSQMKNAFLEALKTLDGAYLPNFVFQNQKDLTFKDKSQQWGFVQNSYSNGAAVADLDNDGDLDYIINNINEKALIYENRASKNFLRLQLKGQGGNTAGFGAKVWLYSKTGNQFQEWSPYRGYQATMEPFLHFGLDSLKAVDSLLIRWPSGQKQMKYKVVANQTLTLRENEATSLPPKSEPRKETWFKELTASFGIHHRHIEEHYADFKVQPLLPHKQSQEGPNISVGDINGDGLQDFFVTGSFKHSGELFFQQANGRFFSKVLDQGLKYEEDEDCLLFDADQDGDLDLYVASGSSEFPVQSPYYQDRLYENDGKGNFHKATDALPVMHSSSSCLASADYDKDGDLDLFVGSKTVPGNYAAIPKSYLLKNNAGKFTDVTREICPSLENFGRITSAIWSDFNQDGRPDLIVVGEWTPIAFFQNDGKKLIRQEYLASSSAGWWNCIQGADIDNDGDEDYVAGNIGRNTPFNQGPLRLYSDDFDQNKIEDAVITYYLQGKEVPLPYRNDLLSWMVSLKKRFPDHTSYGKAGWAEFYPDIKNGTTKMTEVKTFESVWIENRLDSFLLHTLPIEAQFAPIQSILVHDFNSDHKPDILCIGNFNGSDTHTGQYDALSGLVLAGKGNGEFEPLSIQESGFYFPGDARDLAILNLASRQIAVICTQNNDTSKVFVIE